MRSQRWIKRPPGSNWGEFGPDDRIGRLNLLTPAKVLQGIREVVVGRSFCLSLPLDMPGGNVANPRRHPPRLFAAIQDGECVYNRPMYAPPGKPAVTAICDDAVLLYTQYSTQWDSFAHAGMLFDANDDGIPEIVYYNGWRADVTVVTPKSNPDAESWARFEGPNAHELGIDGMAVACLQGRAVMVDLQRRFGRERHAVSYRELMNIMAEDGVEVEPGDILCLYTGYDQVILEMGGKPTAEALHGTCAGLDGFDRELLQWVTGSGLCAIVSDNRAVELNPGRPPDDDEAVSLHLHCLFKLGIPLGEQWYLSELVAWLHKNGRNRFLLTAPPLRLPGAVGSPVTPIATV
jgi:kynurenine formamidase